tara:strand:+ start:638 stop:835 length:198 start_codon:yes stop_codon:yes gene_type:complete
MINVDKNPNFTNWFDVRLFGKIVDNAKTHAKAMEIARNIQQNEVVWDYKTSDLRQAQLPIISNHG